MSQPDNESIHDLLPWYLNGTLSAEEKKEVEAYLEQNPDAQKELDALKQLQASLKTTEPAFNPEFSWKQFERQLNTQPKTSKLQTLFRPVLALAACLVLTLQVLILVQPSSSPQPVTLLSDAQHQAESIQGHRFFVRFNEQANWGQLQTWLDDHQALLISGPNTLGVIEVFLPASEIADYSDTEAFIEAQQASEIIDSLRLSNPE